MKRKLRELLRDAVESDALAERRDNLWIVPCLHCGSKLTLDRSGEPLSHATLEHIVPKSWFGKRAAADLTERVGAPDDPRNLAIACLRCNNQKGLGPDKDGPSNDRALQIVATLLAKRDERFMQSTIRCSD